MIETYKILSGKYELAAIPNLTTATILTTRGNDLRVQKLAQNIICANSFFPNRVVNMWNSRPNDVTN